MFYLGAMSMVLSSLCFGFGKVCVNKSKSVVLWKVIVNPDKPLKRLHISGVFLVLIGLMSAVWGLVIIYKANLYKCWLCIMIYILLCVALLIVGIICGDFVSSKHRSFSEMSLNMLQNIDVIKAAEEKLEYSFAALIGFDGIKFVEKDGNATDVLRFEDLGLAKLENSFQTEALCQYFKCRYPHKEFHSLSNIL